MPFYRCGEPGQDFVAHFNFGGRKSPAPCVGPRLEGDNPASGERCGRMSEALCDAPAGRDLAGKPLTCDAPLCAKHRVHGGKNVDYCHKHAHLAPGVLPL